MVNTPGNMLSSLLLRVVCGVYPFLLHLAKKTTVPLLQYVLQVPNMYQIYTSF